MTPLHLSKIGLPKNASLGQIASRLEQLVSAEARLAEFEAKLAARAMVAGIPIPPDLDAQDVIWRVQNGLSVAQAIEASRANASPATLPPSAPRHGAKRKR